jgi:tripartite-type tricarboxylate transporter receptor subunit TctC
LTANLGFAAEKFPSKPITIVVPWAPGGRTDLVARMVAPIYEKILGQSVIVVNKSGASGFIGFKSVSTAKPDGYTLGMAGGGLMVLQCTDENIRWDEFKWIGQIYTASSTVSVNAESPWKTIEEFVDYARKNPMKLKHGKSDTFGNSHLFSEGFAKAAGIKFTQITYKGDGPAALALASKEVDVSCQPVGPLRTFMEAGKIRVLAFQSDRRSFELPDIPTLKEKGINWSAGTFEGLIAPKDIPAEIVTILERALEETMKDNSLGESFKKFDVIVEYKNNKDLTTYVAQQDKNYRGILKEIGFTKK